MAAENSAAQAAKGGRHATESGHRPNQLAWLGAVCTTASAQSMAAQAPGTTTLRLRRQDADILEEVGRGPQYRHDRFRPFSIKTLVPP